MAGADYRHWLPENEDGLYWGFSLRVSLSS